MKIVFLDFDGVLNSHAFIAKRSPEERGVVGLDPEAVARVNRLVRESGAEVVVSSSWRHNRRRTELCDILVARGFVGRVRGMTPQWLKMSDGGVICAKCRGDEIQSWLDDSSRFGLTVESFVILDDDSDMGHLADRLVKTSFDVGLQDEHVDRAIAMLRAPMPLIALPAGVAL